MMNGLTSKTPLISLEASPSEDVLRPDSTGEFDPIFEIRKLRQELAERLQSLQSEEKSELVPDQPEAAESEIVVEVVTTVEDRPFESPVIASPAVAVDDEVVHEMQEEEKAPEFVLERIQKTQQLIDQLQHPAFVSESRHETLQERRETSKPVGSFEESAIPYRREILFSGLPIPPESRESSRESSKGESEPSWIALLKMMNAWMTVIGFLGIFWGSLYFFRGEAGDGRVGTLVAATGLALIGIGVIGRLAQDRLNRKSVHEMSGATASLEGKLTTTA